MAGPSFEKLGSRQTLNVMCYQYDRDHPFLYMQAHTTYTVCENDRTNERDSDGDNGAPPSHQESRKRPA